MKKKLQTEREGERGIGRGKERVRGGKEGGEKEAGGREKERW